MTPFVHRLLWHGLPTVMFVIVFVTSASIVAKHEWVVPLYRFTQMERNHSSPWYRDDSTGRVVFSIRTTGTVSVTRLVVAAGAIVACIMASMLLLHLACNALRVNYTSWYIWIAEIASQPLEIVALAAASGERSDVALLWVACLQVAIVVLRATMDHAAATTGVPSTRMAGVCGVLLQIFVCVPIIAMAVISNAPRWLLYTVVSCVTWYMVVFVPTIRHSFACVANRIPAVTGITVVVLVQHGVVLSMVCIGARYRVPADDDDNNKDNLDSIMLGVMIFVVGMAVITVTILTCVPYDTTDAKTKQTLSAAPALRNTDTSGGGGNDPHTLNGMYRTYTDNDDDDEDAKTV